MCQRFEPSLRAFRDAAGVTLIYVSSDLGDDTRRRAAQLDMLLVDDPDVLKRKFNIWSGREVPTFGPGRRSGVPALVALDGDLFLDAEKYGTSVFNQWVDSWEN